MYVTGRVVRVRLAQALHHATGLGPATFRRVKPPGTKFSGNLVICIQIPARRCRSGRMCSPPLDHIYIQLAALCSSMPAITDWRPRASEVVNLPSVSRAYRKAGDIGVQLALKGLQLMLCMMAML